MDSDKEISNKLRKARPELGLRQINLGEDLAKFCEELEIEKPF